MKQWFLLLFLSVYLLTFNRQTLACNPGDTPSSSLGDLSNYVAIPIGISAGRWFMSGDSCDIIQMFLVPNEEGWNQIDSWGPPKDELNTSIPEAIAVKLFPKNILSKLTKTSDGGRAIKGKIYSPARLNVDNYSGLDITVLPGLGILAVSQRN